MPTGSFQAVQDFQAGNFRLMCDEACYPAWSANFPRLMSLYGAGQWQMLAESTMQIGYASDLAYFFLASAAQNLGYHDAAFKYYQYSSELYNDNTPSHHCRDSKEGCGGLDLGGLLPSNMAAYYNHQEQAPVPLNDAERAELQKILYVVHAREICSWPISPIVNDEVNKYLDFYKQRLQYEKFNEEDAKVLESIKKSGKKICSSPKERKKYDDIVNHIVPFATAHPEVLASLNAQQTYYQDVAPTTAGAVEVPYVYYTGFWWGAIWFPGGYYDPYWRYYGWGPGPRFVLPPWYPWHAGYPAFWGHPYWGNPGYFGHPGYPGYGGHPGYPGYGGHTGPGYPGQGYHGPGGGYHGGPHYR
jgi:hypothetical protein